MMDHQICDLFCKIFAMNLPDQGKLQVSSSSAS